MSEKKVAGRAGSRDSWELPNEALHVVNYMYVVCYVLLLIWRAMSPQVSPPSHSRVPPLGRAF